MSRIILSNKDHPLFEKLSKFQGFIEWHENLHLPNSEFLLDMTALPTHQKELIFQNFKGSIVSDLSLNAGSMLINEYQNIVAALGAVFPSPTSSCELFLKDKSRKEEIEEFLSKVKLRPVEISSPGIGFIFGRIIVQIINEAWFALEDRLATKDAIDTAMLYGVNYPKGPLAWAEEAGLKNVVALLDELYENTQQERYRASTKLKEASK